MAVYTYNKLVTKAEECYKNVNTKYKLDITDKWSYYFAKAVLNPGKDIKKIDFKNNVKPQQDAIGRQATKEEYLYLAKKLVKFVEEKHKLPDWVGYGKFKLSPRLLTYTFSKILIRYDKTKKLQKEVTLSNKVFIKPVETGNVVYDYTCDKFGKRFKTIDELLNYVKAYFHYQKYFDDHKSNKEVVDSKSGNCTDLLQWLMNNADAMGYDSKCIHVKCRVSGTGHVFGKFRHKTHTGGKWIIRDVAAIADGGGIHSVWCEDGILQAENPSWFMANLHR